MIETLFCKQPWKEGAFRLGAVPFLKDRQFFLIQQDINKDTSRGVNVAGSAPDVGLAGVIYMYRCYSLKIRTHCPAES